MSCAGLSDPSFADRDRIAEALLNAAPTALYVFDLVRRAPVFVSPREPEMLGLDAEMVTAAGSDFLLQTMHPDDLARVAQHFSGFADAADGETRLFEYRMRAVDGTWHWFRSHDVVFARDPDGRPRQILSLGLDVTEHKLAEARLAAANARSDWAEAAANAFSYEWDLMTDHVERSAGLRGVLGYAPEDLAPTWEAWNALKHPDDRHLTKAEAVAFLNTADHDILGAEYRVRHTDGTYRWLAERVKLIRDETGRLHRIVGQTADVTERKAIEDVLRDRERFTSGVANATPGLLYVYDLITHRNLYVNDQLERLFGWTREDLDALGEGFLFALIHPDDASTVRTLADRMVNVADGDVVEVEYRLRRRDGEYRDTYQFSGHDPEKNVAMMLAHFGTKYTPEMRVRTSQMGLTIDQVLTVASMVERETRLPDERPTIADVYLSRWDLGLPMDADPTVQYVLGTPGDWWPALSGGDLFVESPFNTYQHDGLPPGPIANPGLASIHAVLFPDDTPYLFYTIKDETGAHAFAVTVEEQSANIKRYQPSDTVLGTPVLVDPGRAFDAEGFKARLGSGWVVADAHSLVADGGTPAVTGFVGSSTMLYRGPAGSRIIVIVFPLAADPAAAAIAWDRIGEAEFDRRADEAINHELNAEEVAARTPLPVGCREARRLEGTEQLNGDLPIGMTLCAVGSEEILLVLTSGEVLDQEGVGASDTVTELIAADVLAAPIVATHRIDPEITVAVNLRAEPSRTADILTEVPAGTVVRWLGDDVQASDPADGLFWLKVRTADGEEGWMRAIDLTPFSF